VLLKARFSTLIIVSSCLLFSSCAERQDGVSADLQLIGVWSETNDDVADIAVGKDNLFLLSNNRQTILSFDLNNLSAPAPMGNQPDILSHYGPEDSKFLSCYLLADSILFAKLETSLLAYDVRDPWTPIFENTFFANGVNNVYSVSDAGNHYLYYSDRSDGMLVHGFPADTAGVTDQAALWFVEGDLAGSGYRSGILYDDVGNDGNDLVIENEVLYLANGIYGLSTFQLGNAHLPLEMGHLSTLALNGDALRLSVDDGIAVVALGSSGLAIIDVSDPGRPHLMSYLQPGGTSLDVEVRDGYAYVANSSKGTLVIDLHDPAVPSIKWRYESTYARRIQVNASHIFVADKTEGLLILNNPLF
jgi:hypothetical protein